MNSQTVTVNLVPGLSTPAVVRISQYDYGRPILFKVMDGTMPASFVSSTVATVVGTKPSGLGFSEVATISGNTASLDSTLAMTQEAGMIPAEIRFSIQNGPDIGTANFILAVEPSPHPDGTTDGTQETMQDLETRLQGQINSLDSRVDALEAGQGGGSGLTDDVKTALLQIAQKVAYIDANGQDYYDDLYDALYNDTTRSVLLVLSHVSSSNTQSTVEVGDSYTTTLTASTNYTLNSVSVTMGGVDITSTAYLSGTVSIPSVTGNIVITATAVLAAQSITATYTQSGTVYDTDTLDSLKPDLVVTANYSGGTSETVPASNYTLSGTLTAGTSTVTVNYAGLTTTFSVTVTSNTPLYPFENGTHTFTTYPQVINVTNGNTAEVILAQYNNKDIHANVSTVSNNTTAHSSTDNYLNNNITWFTIPAGASVTMKGTVNSVVKASDTTKASIVLRNMSGTDVFSFMEDVLLKNLSANQVIEYSNTFESATDIACLGWYMGSRGTTIEASLSITFELYVNNVRYV